MEGIFTEYPDISKIRHARKSLRRRNATILTGKIFVVTVENPVQSERKLMVFIHFVLIQKIYEPGVLPGKVLCGTEPRVHILIAIVSNERYVLRIVLVQRNADLEVAVYGAVQDVRTPRVYLIRGKSVAFVVLVLVKMLLSIGILKHLPSKSAVAQSPHAEAHLNAAWGIVEPAIGQVELKHARVVEQGVVVVVRRGEIP